MRTVIVRDAMRIPLGKQGENNAVRVVWPEIAEKYAKLYGDGRFELVVVQKGKAYPAVVNAEGADLVWDVHAADVATAAVGSLELIYYVGDTIAKSQTWETVVIASKSADGMTEPQEPQKSWVDEVLKAGASAEKASAESVNASKQSADSAVAAKLSEDNAKQSETGAKSAQSTAEQNAKDAVNAKTAAETAQKSAQESASNAAQSAKDAKTANEFAQGAQQSAVEAAQLSVTKALEAAQSAAEARESADRAEQAADRALTIIDDTALARDKTWSSRNIVDMVCPAIEETGNPVVCTPVPNYPLGVKASWTPTQEGSGEPSPDNIRPIKGRDSVTVERTEDSMTRTLTLPSTIYGGEVAAVTGEGKETWHIISITGKEPCHIYDKFFYIDLYKISGYNPIPPSGFTEGKSSHYGYLLYGKIGVGIVGDNIVYKPTEYPVTVDGLNAWMNYCAEQYVAGTPVQVAYEMAKPIPFTATGNAQIPALDGTNTILTDADTVSVTGRETPQSYIDRKLKETNTAIAAL